METVYKRGAVEVREPTKGEELHSELCKDQPYGRAAVQMLSRLMYLALIQKNWQVLKESATEHVVSMSVSLDTYRPGEAMGA